MLELHVGKIKCGQSAPHLHTKHIEFPLTLQMKRRITVNGNQGNKTSLFEYDPHWQQHQIIDVTDGRPFHYAFGTRKEQGDQKPYWAGSLFLLYLSQITVSTANIDTGKKSRVGITPNVIHNSHTTPNSEEQVTICPANISSSN